MLHFLKKLIDKQAKMAFLLIFFLSLNISVYGQDKKGHTNLHELTELKDCNYMLATIKKGNKMATNEQFLLFINAQDGETTQIDLPEDAYIQSVNQVQIKEKEINVVILVASTVNLNGKKGIDWYDPKQIFLLSIDGKEKKQLTDDNFFVSKWVVNRQTGTIVIFGHQDKAHQLLIYDLKTFKLISNKLL